MSTGGGETANLDELRREAERGSIVAARVLGIRLAATKRQDAEEECLFWLRAAAGQGDIVALRWLLWILQTGQFGWEDPREVRYWLERGVAHNDAESIGDLAWHLWHAKGGERDVYRGFRLALRFARHPLAGDTRFFQGGPLVPEEISRRVRWLRATMLVALVVLGLLSLRALFRQPAG